MKRMTAAVLLGLLSVCAFVLAGDWPQWRGPGRNGVAVDSPALVDAIPEKGPNKLWESEPLHGGGGSGWGSVAVADGRAYVFADWRYDVPKDDRVITKGDLRNLGYAPKMPPELSKKVEAARVSDERKKLDRRTLTPWVNEWVKKNLPKEHRKFGGAVQNRLKAGENAVPLDVLAKMALIVDKVFPDEDALNAWFKENDIDDATRKKATKRIRRTNPVSRDFLVALDAATGAILWKTEVPAKGGGSQGDSTTPTVVGGRVYAITASSAVVCLDAKTGAKIWEKKPFAKVSDVHSSVLVADGVLVASAYGVVGLDAATGETLWEAKKLRADKPSPVVWKSEGGTRVIVNSARKLTCHDVKSGKVMWELPGGGSATPAIYGDHLACIFRRKLVVYKLADEKAKEVWTMPFKEDYASPVIFKDHVYAIGTPKGKKEGRAVCVELATGKIKWDAVVRGAPNCASPIVADGKLVTYAKAELMLVKASPEKYVELGRHKIGGSGYTSPAIANGKLFCRLGSKVICYDLTK